MIITELNIAHYGKMKDRRIELRPGTNVITGDNETGKTTIASFIKAMLYGLKETDEEYRHFFPREYAGAFGGSMSLVDADGAYVIRREFSAGKQTLAVFEGDVPAEDPQALLDKILGGVSRETFEATGFVSQDSYAEDGFKYRPTAEKEAAAAQEKAVREEYRKAKDVLLEKRQVTEGKRDPELNVNVLRVRDALEENQSELARITDQLKTTSETKTARETALKEEEALVEKKNAEREAKLKQDADDANALYLRFKKEHEAVANKKNTLGTLFLVLGILAAFGTAYFVISYRIYSIDHARFLYAAIAAGVSLVVLVLGIVFTILTYKQRRRAEKELAEHTKYQENAEKTAEAYKHYLENRAEMDDAVSEKERRLSDIEALKATEENYEKALKALSEAGEKLTEENRILTVKEEEDRALQKELKAIDIAVATFDRLGSLNEEEGITPLTREATENFGAFVQADRGAIKVANGIGTVEMENGSYLFSQLSTGTRHAVLLALRVAALSEADRDKRLPLILDDVFSNLDLKRMEQVLSALRKTGRQVILMSCQQREKQQI